MARVTFRETLEVGNYLTGEYKRWTKEVEFEGTPYDLDYLIRSVSSHLRLPAVQPRNGLLGMEEGVHQILKLFERGRR